MTLRYMKHAPGGVAKQLLQADHRDPRLRAVHPERVAEVGDRDVRPWDASGVSAAVVQLGLERRGLEKPTRTPVVVERGGEDRIRRPPGKRVRWAASSCARGSGMVRPAGDGGQRGVAA